MSSRSGAHGMSESQQLGQQQQQCGSGVGMKEKEGSKALSASGGLCGCTPTQKGSSFGKGDVATKGTGGGIGQCSYGNASCTCPSSCVCGGNQQSAQDIQMQGQTGKGMAQGGAMSGQKKATHSIGQDQQQQEVQQGKIKH